MSNYHFTAVIWPEGKKYVSRCSELGVASYGATPEKARKALEEAVALYLSNARKLGLLDDFKGALQSQQRYLSSFDISAP